MSLPIYTLNVPSCKIYVINSPALAKAVDRNSRTLSFAPYVYQFAKRILQPSAAGLAALEENLHEDGGPWGCRPETMTAMHSTMAPGDDLHQISRSFLESVSKLLGEPSLQQGTGLFVWMRKLISRSSTYAIYGAQDNPFRDPKVEAGFWYVCSYWLSPWICLNVLILLRAVDTGFGLLGFEYYTATPVT